MKALPEELIEALKNQHVIQTQLGLFYTEVLEGWEGVNPKSGEAISIPGKVMPGFLPSDSFSKKVLHKNFIPQIEIWSNNFSKGTAPLPVPTVKIEFDQSHYTSIEHDLREKRTAFLDEFGTLDLREFSVGDTTKTMWMISFCPSEKLREILNPS